VILKRVIGLVFAGGLAFSAAAADIVIRIAPPRMVIQKRDRSPGRDYVWVQGYQKWNGNGHVWVAGSWERRPQPRSHWVAHRWVHERRGWVFVEGHWR